MKRLTRWWKLGVAVTLATVALIVALWDCGPAIVVKKGPSEEHRLTSNQWHATVVDRMESGYWLVVRGYHGPDHLVVAATRTPWSHAAILDGRRGEIIEAVGSGVRVRSLDAFVQDVHRLVLVRPDTWTLERGEEAVVRARAKVGRSYDFLGTVGAGTVDRFYCSELAAYSWAPWRDPGVKLPRVITPAALFEWGTILYDSGARDGAR